MDPWDANLGGRRWKQNAGEISSILTSKRRSPSISPKNSAAREGANDFLDDSLDRAPVEASTEAKGVRVQVRVQILENVSRITRTRIRESRDVRRFDVREKGEEGNRLKRVGEVKREERG